VSLPADIAAGGPVLGLGCDLVDVSRLRSVIERQGARFLEKVFTETERAYCAGLAHPWPSYAARFAAKEAVSKAFGTGIGAELGLQSISVAHGPRGEPLVVLDAQGEELLRSRGGRRILLSLSHTDTTAMAVVVITG
jgi:holo-[acyl-carrier protein] synthase